MNIKSNYYFLKFTNRGARMERGVCCLIYGLFGCGNKFKD